MEGDAAGIHGDFAGAVVSGVVGVQGAGGPTGRHVGIIHLGQAIEVVVDVGGGFGAAAVVFGLGGAIAVGVVLVTVTRYPGAVLAVHQIDNAPGPVVGVGHVGAAGVHHLLQAVVAIIVVACNALRAAHRLNAVECVVAVLGYLPVGCMQVIKSVTNPAFKLY